MAIMRSKDQKSFRFVRRDTRTMVNNLVGLNLFDGRQTGGSAVRG